MNCEAAVCAPMHTSHPWLTRMAAAPQNLFWNVFPGVGLGPRLCPSTRRRGGKRLNKCPGWYSRLYALVPPLGKCPHCLSPVGAQQNYFRLSPCSAVLLLPPCVQF